MRLVFGLVLVVGLGLAGFAVYMAQNYIGAYENALEQARKNTQASIPVTEVYVTTRAIAYGEEIAPEDVRLAPWPNEILPEGVFTAETPLLREGQARRVALHGLGQFEAILPGKVSEPGGNAGLTSLLNSGESAFAIKVDVASGVSGFLRPGDRVDVYWTGRVDSRDPNQPRGEMTRLIQSGIRLIAIDQSSQAEDSTATIARTVTVAASRDEVAVLTHAQSTGSLTLSLIGKDRPEDTGPIEVDQLSMLGIQRQAPQIVEQEAPRNCVRVRRGSEVLSTCTN